MLTHKDFEKIDVRVGRVVEAVDFLEGEYVTHVVKIDFGQEIGTKISVVKLAPNYKGPELVGKQIVAVVNLEPRQIGKYVSQVLILGSPDDHGNLVLIHPQKLLPSGSRVY